MVSNDDNDPLVGQEVAYIRLDHYSIDIHMEGAHIDIGTLLTVFGSEGVTAQIDPVKRTGNIEVIWQLIGSRVSDVMWRDEKVVFVFSNGASIEILRSPDRLSGTVQQGMAFEEF